MYPFSYYHLFHPTPRYVWHKVRILHETEKAILVTAPYCHARESGHPDNDNIKIWIPKSQIRGIRLQNNIFEIYVKEGAIG